MLILKKVDKNSPGKDIKYSIMGTEITLRIKPLNSDISREIEESGRPFAEALADHVLESFSGVGDENGPLTVTVENKIRVLNIPGIDGKAAVSTFAYNEAKKLAFEVTDAEIKNS